MNERIKELAKNHLVHEHFSRYGERVEEKQYEFYPDELEKFAELIVRECCDMFVELRTRPADLAVLDVKKHFGVEPDVNENLRNRSTYFGNDL